MLENVLFVVTLIGLFAVLTLSLNFLLHVVVILLVQAVVDIGFIMKFLWTGILALIYVRDSFKNVSRKYTILSMVDPFTTFIVFFS